MSPSSSREIIERVQELGPFLEPLAAQHAVSTTLELLAGQLLAGEREELAGSLPAELAQILRSAQSAPRTTASGLFRDVAERECLPLGRAIELTQIVCRALAEALTPAASSKLERCLPELASLFEPPEPSGPVADAIETLPRPGDHDLAGGRPGARRSLAGAAPRDPAQLDSVALSDDPHAGTRLSSARGLSQERAERTLAAGHLGAARPLRGNR